jgi:outer membrane immunogenic protein
MTNRRISAKGETMKKVLGLAGAAFLFAGPAVAADLAVKAPVYKAPPPVFSWTGWYIGLNAGADGQRASFTSTEIGCEFLGCGTGIGHIGTDPNVAAAGTGSATKWGFSGGVQAGGMWQTGALVLGGEADFVGLSGRPSLGPGPFPFSVVPGPTFTLQSSAHADWLATFRARAGVAVDHWLFYVTGGGAVASINASQSYSDNCCSSTPLTTFSATSTKTGFSVGGGAEYALTNNVFLRGEYLYAGGFGSVGGGYLATANSGNSDFHSVNAKLSIQQARVGIDWRF